MWKIPLPIHQCFKFFIKIHNFSAPNYGRRLFYINMIFLIFTNLFVFMIREEEISVRCTTPNGLCRSIEIRSKCTIDSILHRIFES